MRYLLVLDMDLLAADEEFGLEPINYLVARQEQENRPKSWCCRWSHGPGEAVRAGAAARRRHQPGHAGPGKVPGRAPAGP